MYLGFSASRGYLIFLLLQGMAGSSCIYTNTSLCFSGKSTRVGVRRFEIYFLGFISICYSSYLCLGTEGGIGHISGVQNMFIETMSDLGQLHSPSPRFSCTMDWTRVSSDDLPFGQRFAVVVQVS